MKTGRCPICRARMILVKVCRCGCGQGHRPSSPYCTALIFEFVVRAHGCGRRLRPTDSQNLKGIPA